MGTFYRDVRHGVRILLRNPLFTLVAAVSLGLGIGANSALFAMFNSLLWKPLPVAAPDRLVTLYTRSGQAQYYDAFSYPEFRDFALEQVFEGVTPYAIAECALRSGNDSFRIYGEAVGGNYFEVVKPRLQLGRGIVPAEGSRIGGAPVVVISDRLWRQRFSADRSIVGRTITLNNQALTVVGVTAPEFHGVYAIYFAPDIWVPATMLGRLNSLGDGIYTARDNRGFRLMGRMRPGVTVSQAQAAADVVAARLAKDYPQTNRDVRAIVLPELSTRPEAEIAGATTAIALIFLGFSALVLIIACANVANLLLARASGRRKEIAMRLALGASRGQLVRQLLTESILLSLLGAVVGLAAGSLATDYVASVQVPTDLPLILAFHIDARVVIFTFGVSLLAAVAFGLAPALKSTNGSLVPALKGDAPSAVSGAGRLVTLSNSLVVLQVAVSLVLLVGAGLFLRGISGARSIDPGFAVNNRVICSFSPSLVGYDQPRTNDFYRRLLDRLRQSPGIRGAALAGFMPLDFNSSGGDIVVEGRPAEGGKNKVQALSARVDGDYFAVARTRIAQGRAFTANDTASSLPVVIVNETFAKQTWPGQNPIGKRIQYDTPGGPFLEVVGVAADGKYRQLLESPQPYVFLPFWQSPRTNLSVLVEHQGDVTGAVAAIRREVKAIDPTMPIFDTKTMDQFMERSMMGSRLSAMVAVPTGILAALIASVGLYGVMAYSVSRRTREMGIRVAVGAAPQQILGLVMRQGLTLAGVGMALGLLLSFLGGRVIANILFGISPTDPVVYLGVPLLLGVVAVLACWVPARRAVKVDPLTALRME